MLLSNESVSRLLDQDVIPCWETVREVPRVTIDFGDGRKIERTLAGNTVMYVVAPDGRVVDALPGVYTPQDFMREVSPALAMAGSTDLTDARLRDWHSMRARMAMMPTPTSAPITVSKAAVEAPMLDALGMPEPVPEPTVDGYASRLEDVSKRPADADTLRKMLGVPPGTELTPEQLGQLAVEIDSRNNVSYARPAVHMLLASYGTTPTPASCRDDIFKRVLHVPIDDPDLGLTRVLVPGTP